MPKKVAYLNNNTLILAGTRTRTRWLIYFSRHVYTLVCLFWRCWWHFFWYI